MTEQAAPLARVFLDLLNDANKRAGDDRLAHQRMLATGQAFVCGEAVKVSVEWVDPASADLFGGMQPQAVLRHILGVDAPEPS